MEGLFKEAGYEIVEHSQPADVYVINTCSVTSLGDKKSRQLIRRVQRQNPEAVIAVTGCYAQIAPEQIKAIEGVRVVLGTANRRRIVEYVEQAILQNGKIIDGVTDIMKVREFEDIPLLDMPVRTRAFLKIQEGCTNFCSYCIIPFTRGPLRSRPLDSVRREAEKLLAQKTKFTSHGGLIYTTKGIGTFKLQSGFFEDSDAKWIHKAPNFRWDYSLRIGKAPFTYIFAYERGAWEQNDIHSMHTYYKAGISIDPIRLGTWRVYPSISYDITDESYNESRVKGMGYDITALKEFDDRWVTYLGYHYSESNSQNSVFDFDLDSYSKKITAGFSYTFSPKDRIVVGWAFDGMTNKLMDTDYYWYHNIHCAELIVRYREKRDQYRITLQFTPW